MVSDRGVWFRCIITALVASGLTAAAIFSVLPAGTFSSDSSALETAWTQSQDPKPWFPKDPNPIVDEYVPNYKKGPLLAKWSHYFDVYHRHLAKYRGTNVTMIEVGVQSGGSLLMWKWYFGPQSRIFGIDIQPKCMQFAKPDQNVFVMIGDQDNRTFWEVVKSTVGHYDIFLDDGGHKMTHQTTTFEEMYPPLSPQGGVYICEDMHTSYWPEFGGSYKGNTFVELMKDHVDKINGFHNSYRQRLGFGPQVAPFPEAFTESADNVHFYDSVVVIEKMPREAGVLVKAGDYQIPY